MKSMNTKKLREGLQEAGLSEYQTEAYIALLELGSAPATDLANEADVPRSRIYDILRTLEEAGYVETYEQDTLRARAREPSAVSENLQERAETLSATAEEIKNRWQEVSVSGHRISVLKRVQTLIERAKSAIRQADNEIQLSVTPSQFEELAPALRTALADDVFITVSFNTSPKLPAEVPSDEELNGAVTEARHRNLPAPFLVLVDRELTCYAPHMEPVDQYGVVFEDETITYVFHWYFSAALWEYWPVVYSTRDESLPAEYVDIRECIRDITPLLSDGATITVAVNGKRTESNERCDLRGEVVEVLTPNGETRDQQIPTLSSLAGQATLVIDTGEEEFGVGGWGAILEDIEITRIVVESVDYDGQQT